MNNCSMFVFQIYSDIVLLQHLNRIRRGLIVKNELRHGGLFKGGLNRGEWDKSRTYGTLVRSCIVWILV